MATSTATTDYLGRVLANAVPGTTDPVTDFLGREVLAGNLDFVGRALVA